MLIGFDPGRDKCGLVLMALDRRLIYQEVVVSKQVIATIHKLLQKYPVSLIVMGDQTTAKIWQAEFKHNFPDLPVVTVDERFSSQEAKQRYWQLYPAQGLLSLIPQGLRSPPRPIDDIVAIILIERYLSRLISS